MIQLDQDFATVEPEQAGVYEKPEAGGYVLVVLAAESSLSKKSGNEMITLDLDIVEGKHIKAFEKYPSKYYQLCTGENTKYLKGMLQDFYKSNGAKMPNIVNNNGQLDEQGLVHLRIGGSLQEEEYISNSGELKTIMKVAFLCDVEKVLKGEVKPLPLKKLPEEQKQSNSIQQSNNFQGNAPMNQNNKANQSLPPDQNFAFPGANNPADDLPY